MMCHLTLWCTFSVLTSMTNCLAAKFKKEYDYVIIGGGTAGCVVAGRLSEDADKSVLVLEAGPDDKKFLAIAVPLAAPTLGNLSWAYLSEPLKHAGQELLGKQTVISIAKVLGGSGSHNLLGVVRGSRDDFDKWEALGNEGWGYEDVLPYFKKSENMIVPKLTANGYHGVNGPWTVTEQMKTELANKFIEAGKELGFDEVDYNGPNQEGFATWQINSKQGRRYSTVDAFYRPVMGRRNLHIKTDAFVTKIKLNKHKRAVGVYYNHNGKTEFVKVKKEVIVSAGTLNTPKVLMLSGVGPRKHLKKYGIPVVANLPVGENLQDHIATYVSFFINESLSLTPDKTNTFEALADYVFNGKGVWAGSSSGGVAFMKSKTQSIRDQHPHLQIFQLQSLFGYSDEIAAGLTAGLNIDPKMVNALHDVERGRQGVVFYAALLHPQNTGVVQLKSRIAYSAPTMMLNFLKSPKDVDIMIEGIRFIQALTKTKPYRELNTTMTSAIHPSCRHLRFDSDQYWRCYVRHKSFSYMHYTSTCKMSPRADGVVNSRLRVKRLKNVRVVDASIMPDVVSGNTQAAVIMIAEKAADMIKEDAN